MVTVVPLSGRLARLSEFDDSADAVVLAVSGSHCGHVIEMWTAKSNCGDYSVSAVCSCGASWGQAGGGCHNHPPQRPEGDEELGHIVREALSLPDYLWPDSDPPEWWADWVRRVGEIYGKYPEFLIAAVISAATDTAAVLSGLLDKKVSFRQARELREGFRHAKIWRPEE